MDQNQRPHSREKKVEAGSASVGKGSRVDMGGRPVGSGGRSESTRPGTQPSGQRAQPQRQSGYGALAGMLFRNMTPKKLLILVVAVIVVLFLLKNCSGGMLTELGGVGGSDLGNYENYEDYGDYADDTDYEEPVTPAHSGNQPDLTVSSLSRAKRVTPVGGGKDVVTVMIYMCGTDLESKYGMATSDLQEMLKADLADNVNLVIETGGCSAWKNNVISNRTNQIYKLEDDGLKLLENNAGTAAMTDPQNLTTFIKYCKKNYPADRNVLILWDHGGGSLSGYGYDEKNPGSSSMTLAMLDSALSGADCIFDCIGFDACLMSTLETALVCNKYADYLLASEETEPGTGWQYTGWLTELSENTSVPTVELAKVLIDDFVAASTAASPSAQVTLSVIDLAELQGTVPDAFRDFAASTNELLQTDEYQKVSNARAGVRQFAQSSRINQIDLVDLAQRIGTKEAKGLAKALQGCVKYNRATMSNCYGVSIFFPYENTKTVKTAVSSYRELGMDDEYTKCIQSFASLEYGGQIAAGASQSSAYGSASGGADLLGSLLGAYAGSGSSTSPLDMLMGGFAGGSSSSSASAGYSLDPSTVLSLLGAFSGRSMPADYDWVDTELVADQAKNISANYIDPSRITVSEKDGHPVLKLTDKEWSLIQTVELNVFAEDGDGFIDLGLDNTFEWLGDDLLLEYDGTWLTLNGNVCAYYLVSDTQQEDGSWTTVGRIPALLNGTPVNLQVVFDAAHPDGTVTGAYPLYAEEETDVLAKGDIEVAAGDKIQLLCDYYDLDGGYADSYTLGKAFTVPKSGLALSNRSIDAEDVSVMYRLTDIYGNHYWTPVIG